jgi:hypothetical protein
LTDPFTLVQTAPEGIDLMRKMNRRFIPVALLLGLLATSAGFLLAQDQPDQQNQDQGQYQQDQNQPQGGDQNQGSAQDQNQAPAQDPPGRVARLNYTDGSVSYQVSGDQNWVQADPNRPLTTGDNLWADKDSRAEVHIASTAIRMSSETGISFLTLDDRTVQLQLAQGTIEVHLRHHIAGDAFEIDTPNLALTLAQGGEYRIATDPNGGSTTVVVREGAGEVNGGGQSWDLQAGQQYTFTGTDQLTYNASAAPGFDDFEDWCQSRDQTENNSTSAKYVSRDVDGYYDLDTYGAWSQDPTYGPVWVPSSVPVGWAPYQVGHWVYIAPWGWTWVDAEPWGFAPFHYGRWYFVGGRWGWVPGPVVVRPVYAPALVGFVGGGGFSFSVSFGPGFSGVAWFPLGPRDVWVPGYRCSPRYFQTVNITNTRTVNITQVTNVYNAAVINRNVAVNHYTYEHTTIAVTAVSRDTFVSARPINSAIVHVNATQLQQARVVNAAPIAPTRTSFVAANARVSTARPAVPFAQRPVVARLNPATPASRPVYTNDSQPFNREPAHGAGQGAVNNGQQGARPGFQPFKPPANATNTRQGQPAGGNAHQSQYGNRPQIRYAAPAQAHDEQYDVHPPLNRPQGQSKPAPRQSGGNSSSHESNRK